MAESMNEKDVQKYLAAFADGELDVQDNLRVLEHIRMNPQATRRVMHQQQLRQAVARSMEHQSGAVPDDLRAQLRAMAQNTTESAAAPVPASAPVSATAPVAAASSATLLNRPATTRHSVDHEQDSPTILARIGRWLPTGIAACLLVGAALFYAQAHNAIQNPPLPPQQVEQVAQMISPRVQEALTSRHLRCRSEVNRLFNAARFPQDVNALAPVVDSFLECDGHTYSMLDLQLVGYEFIGAGECRSPGARAVHLVYKPQDDASNATLSLWVCADEGQHDHLAKDWLYKVEVAGKDQAIVVWRHEGMVYYLTGDVPAAVEGAAQALAMRP